jgi:hypothetical protein
MKQADAWLVREEENMSYIPRDIVGECNAHLYLGQHVGNPPITMRCQRKLGHMGKHKEDFRRGKIKWDKDERTTGAKQ